MISITKDGVTLDSNGLAGSSPSERGLEVVFQNGVRVFVTAEFIRDASDLLNWQKERPPSQHKSSDTQEK